MPPEHDDTLSLDVASGWGIEAGKAGICVKELGDAVRMGVWPAQQLPQQHPTEIPQSCERRAGHRVPWMLRRYIWNVLRPAGTPSCHSKPHEALTHWIRPDKMQFARGRDKQKERNRSKYSKTCYIFSLVYRREGIATVAATIFDLFQAPWCAGYWQRPKLGRS